MAKVSQSVAAVLDQLEVFYGPQQASWPTDPYLFLVWWHCGYPASNAACQKGWESLKKEIGTAVEQLLSVPMPKLAAALKPGGMVPELRALRLKEIAARVKDELGGDLRTALTGPLSSARKLLKKFPNIADPGADRILLFAGIAPLAAVPSNCPHVLVRIFYGQEHENYCRTYAEAQQAIEQGILSRLNARTRAYLLLKRHGQEICKRTRPKCAECPISSACAYFAGNRRGRSAPA